MLQCRKCEGQVDGQLGYITRTMRERRKLDSWKKSFGYFLIKGLKNSNRKKLLGRLVKKAKGKPPLALSVHLCEDLKAKHT